MKKILLILSLLTLMACSINYPPDFKYSWTVKVTYTDSSVDTIYVERESFKGNPVDLYLKTSTPNLIGSSGITPCLVSQCGFYVETLVCGVRKYQILTEEKVHLTQK